MDTPMGRLKNLFNALLKRTRTLLILVILIGGAGYVYIYRGDFSVLLQFNPRLIPYLVIGNIGLLLLNGIISRQMIWVLGVKQGFAEWFGLASVNAMGNYLGPAHFGAMARAVYMNRVLGLPYGYYLSYLLASYALLLAAVGACGLAFLWWGSARGLHVGPWLWTVCVFAAVGVPAFCRYFGRWDLLARLSPKFTRTFVQGWQIVWSKPGLVAGVWLVQVVFVLTYGATIWMAYKSIDIRLMFWQAALLGLLPMIAYVINVVPGNVGIAELSLGVGAFIIGQDFNEGVSISLIIRCVTICVVFVLGTGFGVYFASIRGKGNLRTGQEKSGAEGHLQ